MEERRRKGESRNRGVNGGKETGKKVEEWREEEKEGR